MTRTAAARRPGLSLLEVIVATFVMAIGMISLLTLFPLGALQMAQALRDARAAETAVQADTHMRLWWQRDVVERAGFEDTTFAALDNPAAFDPTHPFAVAVPPVAALAANDTNPSYPVAVDPLGWQARNGLAGRQVRLAGQFPDNGLLPRRSMDWVRTNANASAFSFRIATMMDDITFNETATPDTASTTATVGGTPALARQGRYNWSAIIQRPVNANRYVADLKILVFDGRSPGIAPLDAEKVFGVAGFAGRGTSQLVLSVGTANPPDHLRAGHWIMDGTLDATPGSPRRNAIWYRIQTIDKDSIPGAYIIDLQTPLLRDVTVAPVAPATTPATQFVVFKGLLEVFDRPQLTPPDYKKQLP